jgi:molybdate-binding protein/DNA-binding XRE family transcriptional regulator
MKSSIRLVRRARGLSQEELARLAGISRQSVNAIEAGRTDPSTSVALALSRALRSTVEELFSGEPAQETLEVTVARRLSAAALAGGARTPLRWSLGLVAGRWVAHELVPSEPASAITGADAVSLRRGRRPRARVHPLGALEALRGKLLVAGCDPALGVLAARLAEAHPGDRLVWLHATSTAALESLGRGETHLAGSHLLDEGSGEYNVPFARRLASGGAEGLASRSSALAGGVKTVVGGAGLAVVNLARWRAGIVVARGNPLAIRSVSDLAAKRIDIVNREPGAGARRLLDRLLASARVPPGRVRGYNRIFGSHAAVAQAVALGLCDAGIASEGAALSLGLSFVPLDEERSDLVLPLSLAQEPRGERLLETLASKAFRRDLGAFAAYDTAWSGRVLAEVRPP